MIKKIDVTRTILPEPIERNQMTNLKLKQTHRHTKYTSGYQSGDSGGGKLGYGIKRYKLLCVKQISNKKMAIISCAVYICYVYR